MVTKDGDGHDKGATFAGSGTGGPGEKVPGPEGEPRHWLGWTLVGVGVASAAGGVVAWSRDKQGASCTDFPGGDRQCLRQLRTGWAALSLAGLAVGTGGVGAWLLLRSPAGHAKISLSLAPSWVGLGGQF